MVDKDKLEEIASLTPSEAADLAKMLNDKWGTALPDPSGTVSFVEQPTEGEDVLSDEFTVFVVHSGGNVIGVIKQVREITGLDLIEARKLVESAPFILREGISAFEATSEFARVSSVGAQALVVRGPSHARIPHRASGRGTQASQPAVDNRRLPKEAVPRTRYRTPTMDFRKEAEAIGVPVWPEPDRFQAEQIVLKIASDARDLFPTSGSARDFLIDNSIDGSGKNAVDLVQERGAAALLMKLDQMRFGTKG